MTLIDDIVLLLVFLLAGADLVLYMWNSSHASASFEKTSQVDATNSFSHEMELLMAECRGSSGEAEGFEQCLDHERLEAEEMMNHSVDRMIAVSRMLDETRGASARSLNSFQAAQSAFASYREAECRWRSRLARNDFGDAIYRACIASLALERAKRIDEIVAKPRGLDRSARLGRRIV